MDLFTKLSDQDRELGKEIGKGRPAKWRTFSSS